MGDERTFKIIDTAMEIRGRKSGVGGQRSVDGGRSGQSCFDDIEVQ